MKQKKSILFYLGNGFMLLSLAGFVFIFSPLLSTYLFPSSFVQENSMKQGTFILIPKIHAQAPVMLNVDPWNERVYHEALQKGVAQAKGTSLPGEQGTTFLFAHSSGMPWELTRFNTIFLRLDELDSGDTIIIVRDGKKFRYNVREKKVVTPTEVNFLLQTQRTQLILQTCTPIGTSLNRLLVFADPVTNE